MLDRQTEHQNEAPRELQILTIQETVARAKEQGLAISEYTLRRALRAGAIPCRIVGKKYLIAWSNVVNWLMCTNGADNTPAPMQSYGGISAASIVRR